MGLLPMFSQQISKKLYLVDVNKNDIHVKLKFYKLKLLGKLVV